MAIPNFLSLSSLSTSANAIHRNCILKEPNRKHPRYLNGRLLFLIISQACTALAFNLRGAMIDRYVYKWGLVVSKFNLLIGISLTAVTIEPQAHTHNF